MFSAHYIPDLRSLTDNLIIITICYLFCYSLCYWDIHHRFTARLSQEMSGWVFSLASPPCPFNTLLSVFYAHHSFGTFLTRPLVILISPNPMVSGEFYVFNLLDLSDRVEMPWNHFFFWFFWYHILLDIF